MRSQLDIGGPRLDFARLAQGMGAHGVHADTAEDFTRAPGTHWRSRVRT